MLFLSMTTPHLNCRARQEAHFCSEKRRCSSQSTDATVSKKMRLIARPVRANSPLPHLRARRAHVLEPSTWRRRRGGHGKLSRVSLPRASCECRHRGCSSRPRERLEGGSDGGNCATTRSLTSTTSTQGARARTSAVETLGKLHHGPLLRYEQVPR